MGSNIFARHPASFDSRPARRGNLRFRSLSRRFSRAAPRRWRFRHDDRERGAEPLGRSPRLASRRGNLRLHSARHYFLALPHRAPGKTLVLQMSGAASTRRTPLLTMYAALVFIFIYLPVVVLILYSFNRDGVGGFPPRHFTLDWYRQLLAAGAIWDAVVNTLIYATPTLPPP